MELEQVIAETITEFLSKTESDCSKIPIGVSNRHVHLSEKAVERLFGRGYELHKLRDLSQPGQFACKETLTIIGPKNRFSNVRVLGPVRGESQVEISLNDGHVLGVKPPVRLSGNIENTPPITLQGPKGQLRLEKGLICAARHIHMSPQDASRFGVSDDEKVQVKVSGERPVVFEDTLVRVSPNFRLEMHIDIDEANAAHIGSHAAEGILIRQEFNS